MSWALAYLGTLAAACFVYAVTRRQNTDAISTRLDTFAARIWELEQAAASPQIAVPADYDEVRETVSTLALAAGLGRNGKQVGG